MLEIMLLQDFLMLLKRSFRSSINIILGEKRQDFDDLCKVAELMGEKAHLTASGLDQIKQIKAGMNRGRIDLL